MEPVDIIRVGNTLGEGVLWDDVDQRLWWTDIQERMLYRYAPQTDALEKFVLPERLCSFGFVEGSGRIVAAFESGFAFYTPQTGALEWIVRPPHDSTNIRFNDGRVDRQSRFWAGSMVEGLGPPRGKLYRLDANGSCEVCETNIGISNSTCFSPNSRTMYFADTPEQIIRAYDFDAPTGALSNRRVFAEMPPDAFPDGAQVDSEGFLWCALWGAGRVVRYTPDGKVDRHIALPATQPSCVAFGGPALDVLYVTTAREGLDARALATQPQAGDVFAYKVGIRGLPDARYKPVCPEISNNS